MVQRNMKHKTMCLLRKKWTRFADTTIRAEESFGGGQRGGDTIAVNLLSPSHGVGRVCVIAANNLGDGRVLYRLRVGHVRHQRLSFCGGHVFRRCTEAESFLCRIVMPCRSRSATRGVAGIGMTEKREAIGGIASGDRDV